MSSVPIVSSPIWIYTIGTIGTIGAIIYLNKLFVSPIVASKHVQTDLSEINYEESTIKSTETIGVQCELDILAMEEDGDLTIVQNQSPQFRWFFLKMLAY